MKPVRRNDTLFYEAWAPEFDVHTQQGEKPMKTGLLDFLIRSATTLLVALLLIGMPPCSSASADTIIGAQQAKKETRTLGECNRRIEQLRKSNGTLVVLDDEGKPLAGASVQLDHVRHDFLFGCNIYRFDRFRNRKGRNGATDSHPRPVSFPEPTLHFSWLENHR